MSVLQWLAICVPVMSVLLVSAVFTAQQAYATVTGDITDTASTSFRLTSVADYGLINDNVTRTITCTGLKYKNGRFGVTEGDEFSCTDLYTLNPLIISLIPEGVSFKIYLLNTNLAADENADLTPTDSSSQSYADDAAAIGSDVYFKDIISTGSASTTTLTRNVADSAVDSDSDNSYDTTLLYNLLLKRETTLVATDGTVDIAGGYSNSFTVKTTEDTVDEEDEFFYLGGIWTGMPADSGLGYISDSAHEFMKVYIFDDDEPFNLTWDESSKTVAIHSDGATLSCASDSFTPKGVDLFVTEGDEITCTYTHVSDNIGTSNIFVASGSPDKDFFHIPNTALFTTTAHIDDDNDPDANNIDVYIKGESLTNGVGFGAGQNNEYLVSVNPLGTGDTNFHAHNLGDTEGHHISVAADSNSKTFTVRVNDDIANELLEESHLSEVYIGAYNNSNISLSNSVKNRRAFNIRIRDNDAPVSFPIDQDDAVYITDGNTIPDIALVTAMGGISGNYTYTLSNAAKSENNGLPEGLTFDLTDAAAPKIIGTPTEAGIFSLTLRAVDADATDPLPDNQVATMSFTVTIKPEYEVTVSDTTDGSTNAKFTLTRNKADNTSFSISCEGFEYRGVSPNGKFGIEEGSPDVTCETTGVTGSSGNATFFRLPTADPGYRADLSLNDGASMDIFPVGAAGSKPTENSEYSDSFTGPVSFGSTVTQREEIAYASILGSDEFAEENIVYIRAHDDIDDEPDEDAVVAVTVGDYESNTTPGMVIYVFDNDVPSFSAPITQRIYTVNRPIVDFTLPATDGDAGDGSVIYTLTATAGSGTNNYPAGLSFDPSTRVLSGTPTAVESATMTYTATEAADSTKTITVTFIITVTDGSITITGPNSGYARSQTVSASDTVASESSTWQFALIGGSEACNSDTAGFAAYTEGNTLTYGASVSDTTDTNNGKKVCFKMTDTSQTPDAVDHYRASDMLRLDNTPPTLSDASSIGVTADTSPPFSFTVSGLRADEQGRIVWTGGSCHTETGTVRGSGAVTIDLADSGEGDELIPKETPYSGCKIKIIDETGNESDELVIPDFTIILPAPVFAENTVSDRTYIYHNGSSANIILPRIQSETGHGTVNYTLIADPVMPNSVGLTYTAPTITTDGMLNGNNLTVTDTTAGTYTYTYRAVDSPPSPVSGRSAEITFTVILKNFVITVTDDTDSTPEREKELTVVLNEIMGITDTKWGIVNDADACTASSDTSLTYDYTPSTTGTTVIVRAENANGKVACFKATYTAGDFVHNFYKASNQIGGIDTTDPSVTSVSLAPYVNDGYLNGADAASSVALINTPIITDASPVTTTYTVVSAATACSVATGYGVTVPTGADVTETDGVYKVCVRSTDTVNNTGYGESTAFTKDTTNPIVSFVPLSGVIEDRYLGSAESSAAGDIVGTVSGTESSIVKYTVSVATTVCSSATGYNTVKPTASNVSDPDNTYKICVEITDDAGNQDYGSSDTFMKDTASPTLNAITAQNSSQGREFSFTIEVVHNQHIHNRNIAETLKPVFSGDCNNFETDARFTAVTPDTTAQTYSTTVTAPEGTYGRCTLTLKDEAGNESNTVTFEAFTIGGNSGNSGGSSNSGSSNSGSSNSGSSNSGSSNSGSSNSGSSNSGSSSSGSSSSGSGSSPGGTVPSFFRNNDSFAPLLSTGDTMAVPIPARITATYRFGDTHEHIKATQILLNQTRCSVAFSGHGSIGKETPHFGRLTEQAVNCYRLFEDLKISGLITPLLYHILLADIQSRSVGTPPHEPPPSDRSERILLHHITDTHIHGDSHENIRATQELLNKTPCPVAASSHGSPGEETTYFGSLTQQAILCFQRAKGLAVNGVLTPELYQELLNHNLTDVSYIQTSSVDTGLPVTTEKILPYRITDTHTHGDSHENIRATQELLNKTPCPVATSSHGSPGEETTYFGSLTQQAIHCFQRSKGFTVDGVLTPELYQELLNHA